MINTNMPITEIVYGKHHPDHQPSVSKRDDVDRRYGFRVSAQLPPGIIRRLRKEIV